MQTGPEALLLQVTPDCGSSGHAALPGQKPLFFSSTQNAKHVANFKWAQFILELKNIFKTMYLFTCFAGNDLQKEGANCDTVVEVAWERLGVVLGLLCN